MHDISSSYFVYIENWMLWLVCLKVIIISVQYYEMAENSWMCRMRSKISVPRFAYFNCLVILYLDRARLIKFGTEITFSAKLYTRRRVSYYLCEIICSLRIKEPKMFSPNEVQGELFVIEYKCFRCPYQWFCTLGEVVPMQTCNSCGSEGRATNVVSGLFKMLQLELFSVNKNVIC